MGWVLVAANYLGEGVAPPLLKETLVCPLSQEAIGRTIVLDNFHSIFPKKGEVSNAVDAPMMLVLRGCGDLDGVQSRLQCNPE